MMEMLGVLGWILGALAFGLYWGERGRRQAAEQYLVSGSPDTTKPRATSMAPAAEAEDRMLAESKEAEEQATERAAQGGPVCLLV